MSKLFRTVEKEHWEKNWESGVSLKPLSILNIFNFDVMRMLGSWIKDRNQPKVIEIGFAPGKSLQYIGRSFGAICHGYDYSESGCKAAKYFLDSQKSAVHIHCQDVIKNPPAEMERADLVYSIGVVEHFENPKDMVVAHLRPLGSGAVALIILPNYTRLNKRIQQFLDPENLAIHNLELMYPKYWREVSCQLEGFEIRTYYRGSINPWMYSLRKFGKVGVAIQMLLNFLGFVLPRNIPLWASMFVIELKRK